MKLGGGKVGEPMNTANDKPLYFKDSHRGTLAEVRRKTPKKLPYHAGMIPCLPGREWGECHCVGILFIIDSLPSLGT